MSIQNLYPSIKPSLLLDFSNTEALDGRITFTRASEGRYYDGKTFAKAEENLLLYSQDFNISWGTLRATIGANATAAPDGTTTADSVTQNSGQTTSGLVSQTVSVASGAMAFSVFAKPNGKNFLVLRETLLDGTNNDTWFNISTGTIGTTDAGHTASITAAANSFYRCAIVFTANAARTGAVSMYLADTDASLSVTDSGGLILWGAQLEQRSSVTAYTATTTQPITNYIPVLLTAASGVGRLDHNPVTGASNGFLVEEQRTNLLTYSEQFDNAAWTKSNATITANTIVAPDGTLTGDKLVEDTATAVHFVEQSTPVPAGTTFTCSFYAKAGERSRVRVNSGRTANVTDNGIADFDLLSGTVETNPNGLARIQAVGNGWYRCSIVATANSNVANRFLVISIVNSAGTNNYTGDGYSGIYIWGAQLEAGAGPATSYIPTVAAQVTRAADAASMTGTNFSSWYRADAGALYVEFSQPSLVAAQIAAISDDTNSNRLSIRNSGTIPDFLIQSASVTQAQISASSLTAGVLCKASGAYAANDIQFAANGVLGTADTSATLPVVSRLNIGSNFGIAYANGHIRKIAFYPRRLANSELQALTS